MAGLSKPQKCRCGSDELKREFHPERWICVKCQNVVVARGTKPQTGICTKCGAKKEDGVGFKQRKNLCIDCYNEYMKDWNNKNRGTILEKKKEYYKKNQKRIRARANDYWQSCPEHFISELLNRTKKMSRRRINGKDRETLHPFDIDKTFLVGLWDKQDGYCALSGLKMEHKYGLLKSASVDRIDSSKGYTKDNVQLVCKFINLGKQESTNEEVIQFLSEAFEARRKNTISLQVSDIYKCHNCGNSLDGNNNQCIHCGCTQISEE